MFTHKPNNHKTQKSQNGGWQENSYPSIQRQKNNYQQSSQKYKNKLKKDKFFQFNHINVNIKASNRNRNQNQSDIDNDRQVKTDFYENDKYQHCPRNQNQNQNSNSNSYRLLKLLVYVKLQEMGFSSKVYANVIIDKIKQYQTSRIKNLGKDQNKQQERNNDCNHNKINFLKPYEFKKLISQIAQEIIAGNQHQHQDQHKMKKKQDKKKYSLNKLKQKQDIKKKDQQKQEQIYCYDGDHIHLSKKQNISQRTKKQQQKSKQKQIENEIEYQSFNQFTSKAQIVQLKPSNILKIQSSKRHKQQQQQNYDIFQRNRRISISSEEKQKDRFQDQNIYKRNQIKLPQQFILKTKNQKQHQYQKNQQENKLKQRQQIEQNKQPRLCLICYYQSTNYEQFPCQHFFCHQCLKNVLLEELASGNYQMKCPQFDCQQQISDNLAKKLLGSQKFKKYLFFRNKMLQESDPRNQFCSKPDCGQLLTQNLTNLECLKCSSLFCKSCLQIKHQGECDQALKAKLQQTYSQFKIKKCPKCQSPIQKIDGCNQMKCKKCRYNFCWLCLRKYSIHHFKYYNCFGCPGMQFQEQDQYVEQRLKQVCFFIFLPLMLTLALIVFFIALPIYMFVCFFVKPFEWSVKRANQMCQAKIISNLCCCLPQCLRVFIGYLLFLPRSLIYAIFLAPIKFVAWIAYQIFGIQTTCRWQL